MTEISLIIKVATRALNCEAFVSAAFILEQKNGQITRAECIQDGIFFRKHGRKSTKELAVLDENSIYADLIFAILFNIIVELHGINKGQKFVRRDQRGKNS